MAIRNMTDYLFTAVTAVSMFLLTPFAEISQTGQLWIITSVAAIVTVAAFWEFRRELVEVIVEFVFAIMYRFSTAGPGLDTFPQRGPVLLVCNHASWLDPMWLAKVLPRTMIAMMNSIFFDHWSMRWIMVYLFDAIRVQESGFRREVPELKDAMAALDAGKCVVIFPEGRLRRSEELPLRMFGQGVWHILPNGPRRRWWSAGSREAGAAFSRTGTGRRRKTNGSTSSPDSRRRRHRTYLAPRSSRIIARAST